MSEQGTQEWSKTFQFNCDTEALVRFMADTDPTFQAEEDAWYQLINPGFTVKVWSSYPGIHDILLNNGQEYGRVVSMSNNLWEDVFVKQGFAQELEDTDE